MTILMRSRRSMPGGIVSSLGTMIDFVNGSYTVDGATLTAADVVSDTGRISEDGLSILAGSGNAVDYLGDFQDVLFTANWTIVFEVDLLAPEGGSPGHRNFLLWMEDAEDALLDIETDVGEPGMDEWDNDTDRTLFAGDDCVVGLNRIAITRTNALGAMSLNGAAAVDDSTVLAGVTWTVAQGAWHNKASPAGFIRSIQVISPVDASELPTLSAL